MKRLVYILLFSSVLFYNNAFTQEDVYLKNEFGYQFNFILDQWFFSKNTTEDLIDFNIGKSSLIEYRRYVNSKNALLIGGSAYFKENNEVLNVSIEGDYFQKKRGYLLRLGWERYHNISKKGSLFYGTEILLSHQRFNARVEIENSPQFFLSDTEYTKRQEENEIGFVPKLGFRYQVNRNLSLSINSDLLISKVFLNDNTDSPYGSDPFFSNVTRNDNNFVNIIFQNPTVIYFRYRFGKN